MSLTLLLAVIFFASFILTMVGLGGGLVFSPMFVLLGFPVTTAVSASLFLNGIAAFSAAITYFRKKMVDVRTAVPLLLTSTLSAPFGAMLTHVINIRLFSDFVTHVSLAGTNWKFVMLAAIFSFAGGHFGSRIMSEKLKGQGIRRIFGVFLLVFFLKLLHKALL